MNTAFCYIFIAATRRAEIAIQVREVQRQIREAQRQETPASTSIPAGRIGKYFQIISTLV